MNALTDDIVNLAAQLWFSGNAFSVLFILGKFECWKDPANMLIQALSVADPLRAGPKANPPLNMKSQMILFATFALSVLPLLFFLKGRQRRREMDEQCAAQADARHQLVTG